MLLDIFKGFFKKPTSKQSAEATQETSAEHLPIGPGQVNENFDPEEITAVIAAAIAACGQQIRIKTISRINGTTGAIWPTTGRLETMNLRKL